MRIKKAIAIILLTALCLSLTACKSSDYKKAVDYQANGYYNEAIELYTKLGDYQDAAARLTESKNSRDYDIAIQLQGNEKYAEAAAKFATIPGFKDADSRGAACQEMADAIAAYEEACAYLKEQNRILDEALAYASEVVLSEESAYDESLRGAVAAAVIAAEDVKVAVPRKAPESPQEMLELAEILNATDYTEELAFLEEQLTALEQSIRKYAQIDAGDVPFIIERVLRVSCVSEAAELTPEDDPNGLSDKGDGYITSVVFSSRWVDQDKAPGDTLLEKGCLAGGQIEIYHTEEQARMRAATLIPADLTAATQYSGMHEAVGTMVIRTSVLLNSREQKYLKNMILAELVKQE